MAGWQSAYLHGALHVKSWYRVDLRHPAFARAIAVLAHDLAEGAARLDTFVCFLVGEESVSIDDLVGARSVSKFRGASDLELDEWLEAMAAHMPFHNIKWCQRRLSACIQKIGVHLNARPCLYWSQTLGASPANCSLWHWGC